jgi:single-strand DNA-binding protein
MMAVNPEPKTHMASLNKVLIIGNLTRDIELRYTPSGKAVADIDLAVNKKWKTESGEDREEVTFVQCTVWDRRAEVAAEHLRKGSPVFIEGELAMEKWTDKTTGKERSKLKVRVSNLQFLGGKPQGKPNPPAEPEEPSPF